MGKPMQGIWARPSFWCCRATAWAGDVGATTEVHDFRHGSRAGQSRRRQQLCLHGAEISARGYARFVRVHSGANDGSCSNRFMKAKICVAAGRSTVWAAQSKNFSSTWAAVSGICGVPLA
jgi:hypothetical protein